MFCTRLNQSILDKNSRLCVGLDPRLEWLPKPILDRAKRKYGPTFKAAGKAISEFNKQIIDVVANIVPVVKPQMAFYEQYGPAGLEAFWETVNYAKKRKLLVIADAKRGDIDSTAQAYANSFLGKTDLFGKSKACYDVDCLTVNPFLGEDSLLPFIETCNKFKKGIFILAKTSNPGSDDFQNLQFRGKTLTRLVSELIAKHASVNLDSRGYSNIGVVVGATFPQEAKEIRQILPHSIFLVPGLGPQGGSSNGLNNFFNSDKLGAIINSSRGIVFSKNGKEGKNYLKIIEEEAKQMTKMINQEINC